jgi:transmembrane sensor
MNSSGLKRSSINEIASAWLERAHSGNWTEQNQIELEAWLNESSAHRAAYWRLEDAWSHASRLSALRAPSPQPAARRRFLPILARTAAVIAVCSALGVIGAKYLLSPETRAYATGLGGHKTITLPDGSRIELNTNTVLRVTVSTDKRTVWLDKGEAYFQIKHDAAHPLVVFAAGHRITDLGTKFLIRQDEDHIEIALIEGRARLDTDGASARARSTVLTPGDVAIATADTMSVTQRPAQKLTNELGWRQGQLVFTETTLGDAAAEFNRYNVTKLMVSDPAVARMKINGTFPTAGAEMFARVAQHILQLQVVRRGDEVVISR